MTHAFRVTVGGMGRVLSQHRTYRAALRRALVAVRKEILNRPQGQPGNLVRVVDRHGSTYFFANPDQKPN